MIDLDAERLWWERTRERLNVAERQRLDALLAAVAQGQAECERLRTQRAEELDELVDDSALARVIANIAPEEVDAARVRLNDGFIPVVTRLMLMFMVKDDGTLYNFVEWGVGGVEETGPMILTLQRVQGKTPNDLRLEALAEVDRLRAALQGIADTCEAPDVWEHGIDGDEYNSWTTCEGRWAIQEQAEAALKGEAT